MSEFVDRMQFQMKKTSSHLGVYFARVVTGSWIGLIFAHFFQYVFEFENFLFLLVMMVMAGAIVRISRSWGIISVVIFNLFCVLVVVLLQMYIKVAPGG